MTEKVAPLTNLVNLQNETTAVLAINANNEAITAAFDNTLSRDGASPNHMNAELDMNSNRIINLPSPISGDEPLRLTDASILNGGGTIQTFPAGGLRGQFLKKTGTADFAVGWNDIRISVQDFIGGAPDGVTDNSTAINAALTYAGSFSSNLGATVWFPATAQAYVINSVLTVPRGVSLVGDYGKSSIIFAKDCDAIHLSLPGVGFGQQTIKGLFFQGISPTAARTAIKFTGTTSSSDVICGLQIENNLFYNFDTAIALNGVQDCNIKSNYALNVNQGCVFTGIVYNTIISDSNFQYVGGVNGTGAGGTSYAGLLLNTATYSPEGVLPPEGITVYNSQFFGFKRPIDADACDTINIYGCNLVGTEFGYRFNAVTTLNNISECNVEMHGTLATAGIYGVPQGSVTTTHRTTIIGNTVQGIVGGGLATTVCYGILVNASGSSNQSDVIIQNNFCKNLNTYDIALFAPSGNTRVINNKCISGSAIGSLLAATPNASSYLIIEGNTLAKTIDYTNGPTDLAAGTVRSSNNTINSGTNEDSTWNVTSGAARFMTFTGPATSRKTYTLPNQNDTLMATGSAQTVTALKTFNSGQLALAGATSGSVVVNATAISGSNTLTLPAATDTLVGKATTDTFSNKSHTDVKVVGTAGAGFIEMAGQSGVVASPAAGVRMSVDSANRVFFKRPTGISYTFDDTANVTTGRTYIMPDANGTFALVDTAWTAYTPTLVSEAGGTIGTGNVITAAYRQNGKTVHVRIKLVTDASFAATRFSLSTPVAAVADANLAAVNRTTGIAGSADIGNLSLSKIYPQTATGATLGVGSQTMIISGTYESV